MRGGPSLGIGSNVTYTDESGTVYPAVISNLITENNDTLYRLRVFREYSGHTQDYYVNARLGTGPNSIAERESV